MLYIIMWTRVCKCIKCIFMYIYCCMRACVCACVYVSLYHITSSSPDDVLYIVILCVLYFVLFYNTIIFQPFYILHILFCFEYSLYFFRFYSAVSCSQILSCPPLSFFLFFSYIFFFHFLDYVGNFTFYRIGCCVFGFCS